MDVAIRQSAAASLSLRVTLASYATQSIEYAFYFPVAGTYEHFPVHVSKNVRMVSAAPPGRLKAGERSPRTLVIAPVHRPPEGRNLQRPTTERGA